MAIHCLTIVIRSDGMIMSRSDISDFVSQAEREGITLAEALRKNLSSFDLDRIQADLAGDIDSNYRTIQDFMSEVSVPSIEEILAMDSLDQAVMRSPSGREASDAHSIECD